MSTGWFVFRLERSRPSCMEEKNAGGMPAFQQNVRFVPVLSLQPVVDHSSVNDYELFSPSFPPYPSFF